MNINLGTYYDEKLRTMIDKGIVSSKTEALRMAILTLEKKLQDEEEELLVKRLIEERSKWKATDFIDFDEVLTECGIDRKKL